MKIFLLGVALLSVFSSCSVIMAARKEGVGITKIQSCHTRGQLIACGATIVSSDRQPSGELVEVYQILKERGSAARALMHGALDVSTCGIWEVIGTPIEACSNKKEYYAIKVYYDEQEVIKKMELM